MKKITIFLVLSFMFFIAWSNDKGSTRAVKESLTDTKNRTNHPIVGKWEYVKTILADGSEVVNLAATEHYYSDGTFLYVNVWLNPQPVNELSGSVEELKNNFKVGYGGIASWKIEKGNDREKMTYTNIIHSNKESIGKSTTVEIFVDMDKLIFYLNKTQVILKRVAEK